MPAGRNQGSCGGTPKRDGSGGGIGNRAKKTTRVTSSADRKHKKLVTKPKMAKRTSTTKKK